MGLQRAAAIVLCTASAGAGCASIGADVRTGAGVLGADVYQAVDWTARLPVELIKPIVIRLALDRFIDGLDAPDDVKARLSERIHSDEFIEWTVPFLAYLKEAYTRKYGGRDFDAHLREKFDSKRSIPGIEHSMFRWEKGGGPGSGAAGQTSFQLTPAVVSGMAMIYDSLFLQSGGPPPTSRRDRSPGTIRRTLPIIRRVLVSIAAEFPETSEIGEFLRRVPEDEHLLEVVTISLIDVTRETVYKSHRRFRRKLAREEQLRGWMLAQLDEEGGGALPEHLTGAIDRRRYGVLVLVDGLEGHLVESLARGDGGSAFMKQVLREELAPPAPLVKTRSLQEASRPNLEFLAFFASRGWRDDAYLPFLRNLYQTSAAGVAVSGCSTTPTISVRNIPIVLTGAPVAGPGGTGIPNFHFLDRRRDRAYYFYGNDLLELGPLTSEAGMRTLFTRLEHTSSLSGCAYYDEDAHAGIGAVVNLAVGEKRRDFGEMLLLGDLADRAEAEKRLRDLRERLSQLLTRNRQTSRLRFIARWLQGRRARQLIAQIAALEDQGMPQLLVYYNPWPDHFAHAKGPFSDEIISPSGELNRLDYWLGEIDRVYRQAGIHDRTLFGMAGDHGLASSRYLVSVEKEVFEALADEGVHLKLRKISSDEGEGPKLTNPIAPPSTRGYDAMISATAGGNCALDFFKDQGEGWKTQPLYRDLTALRTVGGKTMDVVEEIRSRLWQSLDYLAVREEPCASEGGAIRLISTRDGKRADALVRRRGGSILYRFEEADLLGITELSPYDPRPPEEGLSRYRSLLEKARGAREDDVSTWCTESEWRELCAFTARPDSVVQIAHLYDTDLAGTVNLFAAAGFGFNSRVLGRHAGELFHEKDAFVGIWGKPVRRTTRPRTAANGSVAPSIFEHLTGLRVELGKDGWGYPPLPRDDDP